MRRLIILQPSDHSTSTSLPPPNARASDHDNDAVLFEKIKKGTYDADDPIWEVREK